MRSIRSFLNERRKKMAKLGKITVERKFTKNITTGETWVSVTHASEAMPLEGETDAMAQEALDEHVRKSLLLATARLRTGHRRAEIAEQVVGDEEIEEPPAPVDPLVKAAPEMGADPLPADPAWCAVHKTKMKMRSWGGYSHQVGEQWCQGHWCSEHNQPFKKFEKNGATWWSHSYEDPDTGETLWCREDGEQEEIPS